MRPTRWRSLSGLSGRCWVAAAVSGAAVLAVAVTLGGGCARQPPEIDPCPEDPGAPVGSVCDLLISPMCERAVGQCGQEGSVDDCIAKARPKCCQGACGRLMCAADQRKLLLCLQAYVGPDAGFDAEVSDPLPPPSAPISCDEVRQGFAPPECVDVVQLK